MQTPIPLISVATFQADAPEILQRATAEFGAIATAEPVTFPRVE
jgi:hypothetical protein